MLLDLNYIYISYHINVKGKQARWKILNVTKKKIMEEK